MYHRYLQTSKVQVLPLISFRPARCATDYLQTSKVHIQSDTDLFNQTGKIYHWLPPDQQGASSTTDLLHTGKVYHWSTQDWPEVPLIPNDLL